MRDDEELWNDALRALEHLSGLGPITTRAQRAVLRDVHGVATSVIRWLKKQGALADAAGPRSTRPLAITEIGRSWLTGAEPARGAAVGGFHRRLERQQLEWRALNVQAQGWGRQNGVRYEHILPKNAWHENLWPPLRSGAGSLGTYLREQRVQHHSGVHNLLSSWVACANLYFPFGRSPEGLDLLSRFFHAELGPHVGRVVEVELEFADGDQRSPSALLGETGGARGSGQTSPDVAFRLAMDGGRRGLVLVESKLTEHSFYPCSARAREDRRGRPKNPDPDRCTRVDVLLADPTACHQHAWGRKYWALLRPAVDEALFRGLTRCPAMTAGYQLFRQHALAEALAAAGAYALVVSAVAHDERNDALRRSLERTGLADFHSSWAALFGKGQAVHHVFTHQRWVSFVRAHGEGRWEEWQRWIRDRYGM